MLLMERSDNNLEQSLFNIMHETNTLFSNNYPELISKLWICLLHCIFTRMIFWGKQTRDKNKKIRDQPTA